MQGHLQVPANNDKNYQWQDVVEILSVLGSIGGSIASVVTQQIVFASLPLSLAVTLNLVNRRRLLNSVNQNHQTVVTQMVQEKAETEAKLGTLTEQLATLQQLTTDLGQVTSHLEQSTTQNHQTAIAQIRQQKTETEAKFGTLTEQLATLQQLTTDLGQVTSHLEESTTQNHQTAITQIQQEKAETEAKLGTLTEQLATLQQLTTDLGQGTSHLQDHTQLLRKGQTTIGKLIGWLREIETCTQTIRLNSNDANAYYSRGLSYQRLGDREGAIGDYTDAIRINSSYAEAYHTRGLSRAELGDKKGAVEDLREAAKLFFEAGNISNYQIARDLSKKFHELSSQPVADAPEEVAIECLFS